MRFWTFKRTESRLMKDEHGFPLRDRCRIQGIGIRACLKAAVVADNVRVKL